MRKFFTFLCASLMSVSMWALTPLADDVWDESTKTLTVNSNPDDWSLYMYNSEIQHLVFSDAVTSIGGFAFFGCANVSTITIPSSVATIGNNAFYGCTLTSVTNYATTPQSINNDMFQYMPNPYSCILYVPSGSVSAYENAQGWWDLSVTEMAPPVPVADLSKNIAIDLRDHQLGGDGSTGGSKYLIIDSEDNYTYVDAEPAAYNAYFAFDNFNGTQHGYTNLLITVPVEAGNYLLTLGGCKFGTGTGNVKNASNEILAEFDQRTAACFSGNPAQNSVSLIFTVEAAQNITIDCGNWTPYFAIKKMAAIPAFTDFAINFMSDSYTVAEGTLPEGTVIDGTPNTGQTAHGYQNVVATVPVKAGKYRLTLGTCQYGTGTGNVMSETNIELASFDQKTAACYHHNPAENIISMIFDVDQDQTITIDCGQYTPYMKLEKITAYEVVFALGEAEGSAPAAVDVTIGDALTMPVNRTMYKEGYTLTGWSDGENTYAIGTAFTPASDVTLNPVFTQNATAITEATEEVTVRWYFGESNGAPSMHLEGATVIGNGFFVAQATVGGNPMDVRLDIDGTAGKFNNKDRNDQWAQVRANTTFTFPAKEGATVEVGAYTSPADYSVSGNVLTANDANNYYSYLEVTYSAPAPAPADVDITAYPDPQNAGVYYSTFYDSQVKYELPAGVEAYIATRDGANLLLSKIAEAGDVIPADNAVILKANAQQFTITPSDEDAVPVNAINDLLGSDVAIATPANCYVLAGTDDVVGFYRYTAAQLNAHKAYVLYSAGNAPRRMPFIFNGATGIEHTNAAVENLKRIENGQLIIIKNGVRYNAQGKVVR